MQTALDKQYKLRFSGIQQDRNEIWKVLVNSFFKKYIPASSDVLDLGCGWGELINNIEGNRKIGMDLNPDAGQHLGPSVEFINQDCTRQWPLPDNGLDVVFTSNFFEHLPSKSHIDKSVVQIKRCLKPNGRLICLGPNIKYLPGLYWDFWDHYIPLTDSSLSELLELHDFKIDKRIAKFLPYTMANKRPPPSFFVKMYMALPLAWKIFGKQFLIVARNIKNERKIDASDEFMPDGGGLNSIIIHNAHGPAISHCHI
jgi:SAM-dependent methyltransferase